MAFEQVYPIFGSGPRSELSIHYGRFTVSGGGTVFTASADTSQGLTITGAAGILVFNHPKCRFRMVLMQVQIPVIATVANRRIVGQKVPTALVDDATTGILNFNTSAEGGAVSTPVDTSVIEVYALLGF